MIQSSPAIRHRDAGPQASGWVPVRAMQPYSMSVDVRQRLLAVRGRERSLEVIDGRRSALVIVDMQNHFVGEGFLAEVPAARVIVPAILSMAQALRDAEGTIVWIQTSSAGALQHWQRHHQFNLAPERAAKRLVSLDELAEGFKLFPGMHPHSDDIRLKKTHYSAFTRAGSDLDAQLRRRSIDTVLVCGTATNVCCESTARDAMMLDYRVAMLSDACATWTDEEHVATLNTFSLFFGDVLTVAEAIQLAKARV